MRLILFGPGFAGSRIAIHAEGRGAIVSRIGRATPPDMIAAALATATHVISTVPPEGNDDPILTQWGGQFGERWLGYLSSTGVYGDTGGAWVDESAPLAGRRSGRILADAAWRARGARLFRLPGIYGPGRSALDRVAAGSAHLVDLPGQTFSRIHVDDLAAGVMAAIDRAAPAGVYNLADDRPASQNAVVLEACRLLGRAPPPLLPLEAQPLSPAARAFYAENRRVANGRARRLFGWAPHFPDYRAGLRAIHASDR